ncbi:MULTISPECIES: CBS domain-containing protein [unclassified Streptomyces]|uniref:CBS domain-containing protein n=1 Tax=unclassified Streptomyces TaxID=2593676 RepID=UPI0032456D45
MSWHSARGLPDTRSRERKMKEQEKSSAGSEARRIAPTHAWRPDEAQSRDSLLRYVGAMAEAAARGRQARSVPTGPPAGADVHPEPSAEIPVGVLLVRDIMDTAAPSVRGTTPFTEVARALSREHTGSLPVLDPQEQVIGVVSEADLLVRAAVQGTGPMPGSLARYREVPLSGEIHEETAERLMTTPAITVQPGATVAEAAWLACLSRLKRLPVVDREGHLVGTVLRHALLEALVGDDGLRAEIEEVVRSTVPEAADTVQVSVHAGNVTLTGSAGATDVAGMLAAVRKIDGVKEVTDRIVTG